MRNGFIKPRTAYIAIACATILWLLGAWLGGSLGFGPQHPMTGAPDLAYQTRVSPRDMSHCLSKDYDNKLHLAFAASPMPGVTRLRTPMFGDVVVDIASEGGATTVKVYNLGRRSLSQAVRPAIEACLT